MLTGTNSDDGGMFALGRTDPGRFVTEASGLGEGSRRRPTEPESRSYDLFADPLLS